jgi:hypothetical protein
MSFCKSYSYGACSFWFTQSEPPRHLAYLKYGEADGLLIDIPEDLNSSKITEILKNKQEHWPETDEGLSSTQRVGASNLRSDCPYPHPKQVTND